MSFNEEHYKIQIDALCCLITDMHEEMAIMKARLSDEPRRAYRKKESTASSPSFTALPNTKPITYVQEVTTRKRGPDGKFLGKSKK